MIHKYFDHYQQIIKHKFDLVRAKYNHAGIKGSCFEEILKEFIAEFLPDHLNVGFGEVIDACNNQSKQIDIVVVNNNTQVFVKDYKAPNIFIIESVSCVGEVKASLTAIKELEEIIEECKNFKLLKPTMNQALILSSDSDIERFYVPLRQHSLTKKYFKKSLKS